MRWRNHRFDAHPGAVTHVGSPVVSVGNLTLGGTGKTPIVKWLARRLSDSEVRVAIVSRGYGAEAGAKNDEAMELEQSLPDVPHVQNRDRVAAAQVAINELGAQLVLMDDGFQHRRLARDLDMVLLDATEPFGFGRVFPRGALREPVTSLRRADVVCLTRSDMVDSEVRSAIQQRVAAVAPAAAWCESIARPGRLIGVSIEPYAAPREASIDTLRGLRVAAFCGIGNPAAFRTMLESLGAEIHLFREFPDHYAYAQNDIELLAADAEPLDAIICTHKDLVKISLSQLGDKPLWAVEIEAQITVGEDRLEERLAAIIETPH
jgi:tetraacyldisaccharide 4'-kinase